MSDQRNRFHAGRPIPRRAILKAGAGAAIGLGAMAGMPSPASAQQNGTPLCDNVDDSAWRQSLGSSDLCIPYFREHDNSWGYIWGDSFRDLQQFGDYIGSPVMLCQDNFDASGNSPISFTWAMPSGGRCEQLFNYTPHSDNGYGFETSRIPNDCIEFGGRTYLQYTSVAVWAPPSGYDGSLMSGVAYSDDHGVTWHDYPYHWPGDTQGTNQSMYGMWSFAGIDPDGWLYIFSKRWNGSHNNTGDGGAIQLFRIQPGEFRAGNFGAQQNWAYVGGSWRWTTDAAPSPILQGHNIGEFSVKRIGNTYCMSYFDVTEYAICTRTASRPDAGWTAPKIQIVGDNTIPGHWGKPQRRFLYGGYIHPGSASASSLTIIVSQWGDRVGPGVDIHDPPYWAVQYDGIAP